jgi:hypothetical protein
MTRRHNSDLTKTQQQRAQRPGDRSDIPDTLYPVGRACGAGLCNPPERHENPNKSGDFAFVRPRHLLCRIAAVLSRRSPYRSHERLATT